MALRNKKSATDEFAPVGRFQWAVGQYQVRKMFAAGPDRLSRGGGVSKQSESVLIDPGGLNYRVYTPLEDHRNLFTIFAGVKTSDDVLQFAESYGHLGICTEFFVASTLRGPTPLKRGERITDWQNEALIMAAVLNLWSRIQEKDLRSVIVWEGNTTVRYCPASDGVTGPATTAERRPPPFRPIVADARFKYQSFFHGWKRGDLEGPARLYLAAEINSHLQHNVTPQLVFDDSHQFKEYIRPLNLLEAMWYQMCRAFTGDQPIRRCAAPDCGRWMVYERSTKTMHEACAARLRQRRYREAHDAQETKTR
jgi:hypothetical protein